MPSPRRPLPAFPHNDSICTTQPKSTTEPELRDCMVLRLSGTIIVADALCDSQSASSLRRQLQGFSVSNPCIKHNSPVPRSLWFSCLSCTSSPFNYLPCISRLIQLPRSAYPWLAISFTDHSLDLKPIKESMDPSEAKRSGPCGYLNVLRFHLRF